MRVRYGRWSGTQDPFPHDVSPDTLMDELGDDLLEGYGADTALQRLLQRGFGARSGRVAGLDDLRRRVEEARRRELGRMGLDGPLNDIAQRLSEIVATEQAALELSDDQGAGAKLSQLDALPRDTAAKLRALQDYDWHDQRAGEEFAQLLQQLRTDVAEATFGRLAGALGSVRPEDVARMNDMLAELNGLIARHERGEDVSADFAELQQRYGDLLPDADTLEELLEEMARRMAAMSQLLAGLDPDQRAELAALAEQVLGDLDLSFQTSQLQHSLQQMFPELGWFQGPAGATPSGRESGSLSDTVDWIEHLQDYDDLAEALRQDYAGARLEDVDEDRMRELLGEEAVRDLRALREVEKVLEEAGAASRQAGRLELTPQGIRRLGERSLARIYDRTMVGASGSHAARSSGGDGELTGSTRPLQFGDPFRLDVGKTIRNAVLRNGAGASVRLAAQDFELAESDRRVRAATVLLLDMSFSMPLRGNWVPAKRVALALQSLIDGKFPEDRFYVVGFSDYARRLQPRDLLDTGWERVYGTNMQHAFMIARRLLGGHPDAEQHVIMVTDGEPTAHLEGDQPLFSWPPEPKTLALTMREASRLARTGATLNVFLLDHDPGAAAFIEKMVGAYGGRIFYPDLEDLGHTVVRDFLTGRHSR